jgi:ATP-dependent Clp protease, protease subunit
MGKKIIDIDGFIGSGGYSSQYVKNALREAKDDDVEVHINSLGGDVSHAIAIKDALEAHGNVTAIYSGMSASSATIISLGCKSVKMTKDSFYLVHKPMMYVDAWGALNEDELKDLIGKLDSKLESTQKITLQMAKMYSDKSGFPVKSVLDLMKKNVWLSAVDALKWNFVDTLTDPVKVTNYAEDLKLVALLAGNDLPPLPRITDTGSSAAQFDDITGKIEKAGETLLKKFTNFFSNHKINSDMTNPNMYALLCVVLALHELKPDDEGSIVLNKEQLDKIEAEIKKLQDAKTLTETELATTKTALTAANAAKDIAVNALAATTTEKEAAVNTLSAAITAMDDLDATVKAAVDPVAKVEVIRKKLAEKPGAAASGTQGRNDNPRKKIEGSDEVTDYVKKVV